MSVTEYMATYSPFIVAGILLVLGLIEVIGGLLDHSKRKKDDYLLEIASLIGLSVITKPGIILAISVLVQKMYPNVSGFLTVYNVWLLVPVYILVDDFLQYIYHRAAHEYKWLWKHHRPHHTEEEMGLLVTYRNSAIYFLMMPNIWWMAFLTAIGGGASVAIGIIFKQLVIISSHSTTKWDRFLYRYKILAPLTYVITRIFVTPAFHFAHHGKSQKDGISNPNGNFGNMFSIWDQLFGSASFNNAYPEELGLPNDPKDGWAANYLYPLIKSKKPGSEISNGFQRNDTKLKDSITIELEAGNHLWCKCGYSKSQPFCDGSHQGSKEQPLLFSIKKAKKVKLCACKKTKTPPYCDNTHLTL